SEPATSAPSVPMRAGEPETPGAGPPDGDSTGPDRRWAGNQRSTWLAAAGALGLVLTAGAVTAVLVTSHRSPQLPAPAAPAIVVTSTVQQAPAIPASAVPSPAPGVAPEIAAGNVPPAPPVGEMIPAPPPAAPEEPAGATPGPAAVPEFRSPQSSNSHRSHQTTHKTPPPAPQTNPPPPRTPDWVKQARDW
ncbi:MAG: hypothetical protein ACRDSH_03740, partial [Pseudonocardiaceae bacterium]